MRYSILKVLLSLVTLLLIACQEDSETATLVDPFPDQFDAQAYTMGYFPMDNSRDAILLAMRQVNELGGVNGIPFKLVSVSLDNLVPIDVVAIARRMVEDYHIQIVGASYSSTTLKLAPITVPSEILQVSELATSPLITHLEDHDFVFRLVAPDILQGRVLAQLAKDQGAQTCTLVLNEGDAYGQGIATEFQKNFTASGGQVLDTIAIPPEVQTGFSEWFPRIYGATPDCILFTMIWSGAQANLLNEAKALQSRAFYLFSDAFSSPDFMRNIADVSVLNNSLGVAITSEQSGSLEYQHFADSYRTQFQRDPEAYTVFAYDLALILALAIEQAGRIHQTDFPTGKMVRDQLRSIVNPPGIRVGPSQLSYALQLIQAGQEIDYVGATNSEVGWDSQGDVTGNIVYEVFSFSPTAQTMVPTRQISINVPLE